MADRATQVVGEALTGGTPHLRVSQVVSEALTGTKPSLRVSQVVVEVLTPSHAQAASVLVVIMA